MCWAYRDNSWLQTKTLGNGDVTTYIEDAQGKLRDLVNKTGTGTVLCDFAIPATGGYDGAGNRRSVTASLPGAPASYSGTTSYAYDYGQSANPQMNRSQVTGETSTRAGGYTNAFAYDGGTSAGPGNPTSFKGATRTFNANNQQTNAGYGYDGNGNPTTYKAATLTFDPENRMTAYGTAQTDAYSGDGLRVWKQTGTTPGTRTYFLYDGEQPVCEYNSSGSFTAANTYGADGLVSTRRGSPGTVCFVCDERGNVSQRTSSTGAVTGSEVYDAYGARTGTAAQPDPFGYGGQAGYYTDAETGLILCTHRYYDPGNGRWLTRDPMGYAGGINLYGYVGNDPVDEDDPEGLIGRPVGVSPDGRKPPGGPYYPGVPQHPTGVDIYKNIQDGYDHRNWPTFTKWPWIFGLVAPGTVWDYKQDGRYLPYIWRHYGDMNVHENIYDAFGNFNFGAVAAAAGIPEADAIHQADINHKAAHFGADPTKADHGDWWIKKGYDFYREQKRKGKCP